MRHFDGRTSRRLNDDEWFQSNNVYMFYPESPEPRPRTIHVENEESPSKRVLNCNLETKEITINSHDEDDN